MNKKKIINNTVKTIRLEMETLNQCAHKKNWEMYNSLFFQIRAEIDFLYHIDIITYNQFKILHGIFMNQLKMNI